MSIGTHGRMAVYEHFMAFRGDTNLDTAYPLGSEGVMCVGTGITTLAATVNEPGGVLKMTTDTTVNDNTVLFIGPFKPADGGVWMEARFKVDDITDLAVYVGFTETLAFDNPAMPAEFATESYVYNGSGGMVGLQFDKDATTTDWRAVAGDSSVAAVDNDSDTSRAFNPPVNDKYDIVRVEIDPNGDSRCYLSADSEDEGGFKLVKSFTAPITPGDMQYAVVFLEGRADAAAVIEVDYFNAASGIDWAQ